VNIGLCVDYFKKMAPMNLILEMEIGITGGVEDGVDNSGVSKDKLYSTTDDVWLVYSTLNPISEKFTIAAAFGNVHGVYKPGNVKLQPELLDSFQKDTGKKLGKDKPYFFVFHGGSGSLKSEIDAAVSFGVVKMNVDTDTQWAYWEGLLNFYKAKSGYLQGQIGNPEGSEKPNKSYYDPRQWLRECEVSMCKRVIESCQDLKNMFEVGEEVAGRFNNGQWCNARVKGFNDDGTYELDLDDTDQAYPTVPKKAPIEPKKAAQCLHGHRLEQFATDQYGWYCNTCRKTFPQGTTLYGCRRCNYDLCGDCLP
jgi:ketose-bisphosphate aldolase